MKITVTIIKASLPYRLLWILLPVPRKQVLPHIYRQYDIQNMQTGYVY